MSKAWCACFMVESVTPRATKAGISRTISVVLPLPLQPASPKIFMALSGLQDRPRRFRRRLRPLLDARRLLADMHEAFGEVVVAGDQRQQGRDPQADLTDQEHREP